MASRNEKGTRQLDYSTYRPGENGKNLPEIANMSDVESILRLAQSRLRSEVTTAIYPPTAAGLAAFKRGCDDFFEYIVSENQRLDGIPGSKHIIPDLEGLAVYLGISRKTLFNYSARGGEWETTIEYVKNAIASVKKEVAYHYGMPPVLAMFDLTNNHGYVNSSEFKIDSERTTRTKEENRLTEKLDNAGLVWDAERGEYVPVVDGQGELIDE